MIYNIAYSILQNYAATFSSDEPPLLTQIAKEAQAQNASGAKMISGHFQGRVLAFLSRMIKPQCILEIGTYVGYSTLCLAEGLNPGGTLHTIDKDKKSMQKAMDYFKKAGKEPSIQCHIGNAIDVLPLLRGPFDLVFIDADKKNYSFYYDLVLPKVRSNGLIMVDNVFWHGNVIPELQSTQLRVDAKTQTIIDFNHKIKQDHSIEHVLLPIRDGLMIIRKK